MDSYTQTESGVFVPTGTFAEPSRKKAQRGVETQEIATTRNGRDITRGYIDALPLLPPTDSVLRNRGGDYAAYDEVLRDDQVIATIQQRQMAVVARQWSVEPGGTKRADKKAADFITEQLESVKWDNATKKMLFGAFYGFAAAEMMWTRDGAHIALDAIKVRDRKRFGFDPEFRLKLLTTKSPNGEELPEKKFWWFSAGATHDDEPYGLGLAHWLYWPVFFKRNGLKFWLIFLDKFGMPTSVGKYPTNATPEEKSKLLGALGAIQTDGGVIVPEGMVIELLEAARSGNVDYGAFYDRMDAAISKVVLGQTMTTDDGSSQSQANVHMDVRQDLVKADADLICESFNYGPVRWLTEWNFPGATPPRVYREVEEPEDLDKRSDREKKLFDMGFKPTLKHVQETYQGEFEEKETPPALEQPRKPGDPAKPDDKSGKDQEEEEDKDAEFAELLENAYDQTALDDAIRYLLDGGHLKNIAFKLLDAILYHAQQTPDQLLEKLADLYPEMDDTELTESLARIIFIAETWGRIHAQSD